MIRMIIVMIAIMIMFLIMNLIMIVIRIMTMILVMTMMLVVMMMMTMMILMIINSGSSSSSGVDNHASTGDSVCLVAIGSTDQIHASHSETETRNQLLWVGSPFSSLNTTRAMIFA